MLRSGQEQPLVKLIPGTVNVHFFTTHNNKEREIMRQRLRHDPMPGDKDPCPALVGFQVIEPITWVFGSDNKFLHVKALVEPIEGPKKKEPKKKKKKTAKKPIKKTTKKPKKKPGKKTVKKIVKKKKGNVAP
jgi:hypothetical protein